MGSSPSRTRCVVTMQGKFLALDYRTRAIRVLAEGLGDGDGIVRIGRDYLISEWPGLLHLVHPDGRHDTLIDTRARPVYYNDILLVGDVLYTPNWEPGSLTAFRVRARPDPVLISPNQNR
jgi:hypothetical protein